MARTKRKTHWADTWETYRDKEKGYDVYSHLLYRPFGRKAEFNEAECRKEYDRLFHDGRFTETGRRKFYREMVNNDIRGRTRQNVQKLKRDPEAWYDMDFPDQKDGKRFIWAVW